MAIYTPTYGGVPIFGAAVRIQQVPEIASQQAEAFFGVPGVLSVFGGHRGRTFQITGVLYDSDLVLLNSDEDVFTPGVAGSVADGVARSLSDTRGRTWANVIYLGEFQPDPRGPVPGSWGTGSGWVLPYRAVFRGLS
jgi:hypothetical protein